MLLNVCASPCSSARTPGGTISVAACGDEIRRIAESHARLEIKKERHAGELIQVIHHLRTQRCFRRHQFAERHETLTVVGFDIEQRKVFRLLASRVFHLQNDLILIFRLLDQVEIVLRVGVAKQRQNSRFRDAIGLCLIATKLDVQIGSVVVKV